MNKYTINSPSFDLQDNNNNIKSNCNQKTKIVSEL